jgi:3-deoxy-manno-octulosonate cytidylyltransferase (CMP-KDO synthetase)
MIEWAARNAQRMGLFDEVLVATDHEAIKSVCEGVGILAVMTDPECPSGTDRIHQALVGREADIVVNIQGDEPAMPSDPIARALRSLQETGADVATACVPIVEKERFEDFNIVKVVRDLKDRALYFSRSPIPSLPRRDGDEISQPGYIWGYKHLGLYIYRRDALTRFCRLSPTSLERQEKLEQLRMMEHGFHIQCVTASADSVGVDVAEDLARAEAILSKGSG